MLCFWRDALGPHALPLRPALTPSPALVGGGRAAESYQQNKVKGKHASAVQAKTLVPDKCTLIPDTRGFTSAQTLPYHVDFFGIGARFKISKPVDKNTCVRNNNQGSFVRNQLFDCKQLFDIIMGISVK